MPRRVKTQRDIKTVMGLQLHILKRASKGSTVQWRIYCNEESTAYSRLERALLRTVNVSIYMLYFVLT